MKYDKSAKENTFELIGETPLVQLNKLVESIHPNVFAKLELCNPSLSTKDRIVYRIIKDAEEKGLIKKNDHLVEATSGNTGISLAMMAGIRGYKCILFVKDTITKEKYDLLKTFGAQIELCQADLLPDDPNSYYSRAKSYAKNTPDAFYINQNFNPLNTQVHFETTGPEIWEQTQGKVTHLIASGSTGGTISGIGKYLKQQNPDIKVIGVDTKESILKHYHDKGSFDSKMRYKSGIVGVGKNIITGNFDFELIDEFVYVDYEESAEYARQLMRLEGIWAGHSSGAAIQGLFEVQDKLTKDDTVVLVFSDHGSRYMTNIFKNTTLNGHHSNRQAIDSMVGKPY